MPKIIILLLVIILIILTYLKNKNYRLKICLCVIAKNENLYIREFVEHYKKIGYNNIFIYDNNEKNGEHFEEVINDYIKNNFVKIVNFRERNTSIGPQFEAYRDCFQRNNKYYDWLSFYDVDEFLELNEKYKTIQDFLNDKIFKNCQVIKINWFMYLNKENLYYENKPIQERIKSFKYNDSSNKHIKSTVKGNLGVNYWKKAPTAHSSSLNITSCSSSGKKINFDSPYNEPPDYTNAKLNHYYYKSFEEFCIKIKKGRVSLPRKTRNENIKKLYKIIYLQIKDNDEKKNIFNRIFNKSLTDLDSKEISN